VKFTLARPVKIPPPAKGSVIETVPLSEAVPGVPIETIRVARPRDIPADEKSASKTLAYEIQVRLYSAFSPMQPGLPPIDCDPVQALRRAYTWPRKATFPPPALPAEFLGSPDLGSLAVRGPYACYTERDDDGIYKWDLWRLGRYDLHDGLHDLGVKVLFRVDPARRGLEAFQICTALGSAGPEDPTWELSKKIALCAATTHVSLVRHFNWVHLASTAHLAIATRNRLPPEHHLCRLLWPHVYGTQQSNDMVTRGQMARGGDFETIFSFTFDGMCRLFEETYREFRFTVNDPEQDANARQIRDAGFETPTQQNLEALFNVMHEHARYYLRLYYPDVPPGGSTMAIRGDEPVLAWLDELNAAIPSGVQVSRTDVTFDSLTRLVARIIYLVTVQHEILGSFVWNYQLWTHRQPLRVYTNGQREPLDVYQRLVNANYNLNVRRRALVYDFSYLTPDAAGKGAFVKFGQDLKALQASMEQQPWTVWKLYPKALKANINA
jgi:arachidonate 15-lipoxygenase